MERAQVQEVVRQGALKAQDDEVFRGAFLSDPAGAIHTAFGVTLPAEVDVTELRSRVQGRFATVAEDGVLDDAQLESVAGGGCVCIGCVWS
jgi:hypothetical protein